MPSPAELHVDQALTDFSVAVSFQNQGQFVARRAFPAVSSPKQSDKYHVYSSADLLRSDAKAYSGKGPTAGREFHLSPTSFWIEPWGLHYDVGRHERGNADQAIDVEEDAAAILMQDLMIREDIQWAAAAFVTGVWGTSSTTSVKWDDAASTPIEDITTGETTILQNTGRKANKLVVGYLTWASGLRNHPDLLDRIKHTATGVVTESLVAGVLELDEVIVASAVRNSADEGATASDNFILTDNALLLHSPNNVGLRQPAAGKTFTWGQYGPQGILTERFDVPAEGAYPRVQSFRTFDHKITASALGYIMLDNIT